MEFAFGYNVGLPGRFGILKQTNVMLLAMYLYHHRIRLQPFKPCCAKNTTTVIGARSAQIFVIHAYRYVAKIYDAIIVTDAIYVVNLVIWPRAFDI